MPYNRAMPSSHVVSEVRVKGLTIPGWLVPVGRAFYAVGLAGIGIQQLIFRDFIPVTVPYWPEWIPWRPLWAWVFGAALVAAAGAILFNVRARTAAAMTGIVLARAVAAILGFVLLALVAFDDVPSVMRSSPGNLAVWTNTLKALALSGGAWVVAGSLEEGAVSLPRWLQWLEKVMPIGRAFLPVMVIVFGVDHFVYSKYVAAVVPGWAPGGAMFWTYFVGGALIAAGVAMLVGIVPRLAALMLGIMIFLWVPMVHIPRAIADPHSGMGNELTSVFEALAFSGIAFVLAALAKESRFSIARR